MWPCFSHSERGRSQAHARQRRIALLAGLVAALLATDCGAPSRRRPTGYWAPTFLSVRFDSARSLHVVSNLLTLDTAPSVVEDVAGIGGRVTGSRNDTLLIEPYYITMYDASRDDRERTFYRGGAYRLPDLALVEAGAGVVLSEYSTPAARKSRDLDNAATFVVRVFPVLLFLNCLKLIWHH